MGLSRLERTCAGAPRLQRSSCGASRASPAWANGRHRETGCRCRPGRFFDVNAKLVRIAEDVAAIRHLLQDDDDEEEEEDQQ
jgi:hypothetical protein